MVYQSTVTFTMDTICPWTYLALTRLLKALKEFESQSEDASSIKTNLSFRPYQLYPDYPADKLEDKRTWYTESYFQGDADKVRKYEIVMRQLLNDEGLDFKLEGEIGSTFDAHRVLQFVQDKYGAEAALKTMLSLYEQYFSRGNPPAADDTLVTAMVASGAVDKDAALKFVQEKTEYAAETKERLTETKLDGVDSVPVVNFEGRRRDLGLVGAKEVAEYVKALGTVAKESR